MPHRTLAKEFTPISLLKFVLPSILMMIFMTLYTAVDAIFIVRLISENALSALNIALPVVGFITSIGLMLATGSNALIAYHLGRKEAHKARKILTLFYLLGFILGLLVIAIYFLLESQILNFLGATPLLYDYTKEYLGILILFTPMTLLQMSAQVYMVTTGNPNLGLVYTILGGITNVILDYLFMGPLGMGIMGAAIATGLGYTATGLAGLWYFSQKKSILHFEKPLWDFKVIIKSCINGSSELISNLSFAITTLLLNLTMLRYAGEAGVAAITALLSLQFIQISIYMGYSLGVAPIISYKYGEENYSQLKQVIKNSLFFILSFSVFIIGLSWFTKDAMIGIFFDSGQQAFALAQQGMTYIIISYLFMGFNIFISALFTAFGNGIVSGILSLLRTFVFLVGALTILPNYFQITGVWLAIPLAEGLALIVSLLYYYRYKTIYHY